MFSYLPWQSVATSNYVIIDLVIRLTELRKYWKISWLQNSVTIPKAIWAVAKKTTAFWLLENVGNVNISLDSFNWTTNMDKRDSVMASTVQISQTSEFYIIEQEVHDWMSSLTLRNDCLLFLFIKPLFKHVIDFLLKNSST